MTSESKSSQPIIAPHKFGVSFSAKQCRNFGIAHVAALDWLIANGFRRFRLMSYWNDCQPAAETYDFSTLDQQMSQVRSVGGEVTLCLGVKQPRWPEYHWPKWALDLPPEKRTEALLEFVRTVVERYREDPVIVSWQLENEALLQGFGETIQIDRARLRAEYALAKKLDYRPIIMSTSNGWGIPFRAPQPDVVGFSLYTVMHKNGAYHRTIQKPWLHRVRKALIRQPVFIHELQTEPWGPKAIWEMPVAEQYKSMSIDRFRDNLQQAASIGAWPIDLWGGEWWYWLHQNGEAAYARQALQAIRSAATDEAL